MSSAEDDIKREIGLQRLITQNRKEMFESSRMDSDQQAMVTGFSPWLDPSIGQSHPTNYSNLKALLRIIPEFTAAILKKVDFSLGSSDVLPYTLHSDNESHKNQVGDWLDNIDVEQIFRTSFFQLYFYGDLYWNLIADKDIFEVVSADTIKVNTDEFGNPESYVQTVDGNPASPIIFFPSDIVHTKLFELGSEIYGFTQSESLLISMIRLLKMENYNASFLNNNATPRGAWSFRGMAYKEYKRLLKSMKKIKPHKDLVVYTPNSEGSAEYKRIGLTMEEMSFQQGLEYQLMKIVKGTGVPNIILGDPQNSNRATALTQFLFTMIPIYATQRLVADKFNTFVVPRYFGFNDVKISFPKPDMRTKSEKANDVQKMIQAISEGTKALGIVGLDGSVLIPELLLPLQIKMFEILEIPYDFSQSTKSNSKSLDHIMLNLTGASGKINMPNDNICGTTHLRKQQESESDPSDVKRQSEEFTNKVDSIVKKLAKGLNKNYDSLENQIMKILANATKAIEQSDYNRTMKKIEKEIDSESQNEKELSNSIRIAYLFFLENAAKLVDTTPGTEFDKAAIKFLEQARFRDLKGVNEEMKKRIGFELAQAIKSGESTAKIATRISKIFDAGKSRLDAVASTAIAEAMIEAEYNQYKDADIKMVDVLVSHSEATCSICLGLESQNPHKLSEARSLLPAHTHCKCDLVPSESS